VVSDPYPDHVSAIGLLANRPARPPMCGGSSRVRSDREREVKTRRADDDADHVGDPIPADRMAPHPDDRSAEHINSASRVPTGGV